MENITEIRYLSNLIGLLFVIISLVTLFFIEEKLIRHEKDAEGKDHQNNHNHIHNHLINYQKKNNDIEKKKKKGSEDELLL